MLSLNEIRRRAIEFAKEWENAGSERADKQSFYNAFFEVFGISRRRVASFEEPVKKLGDRYGWIDLFWKGKLLVEHKSRGKDLDKAYSQALDYFANLPEKELPQYVLVSDFDRFRLYDLDKGADQFKEFALKDLHKNIQLFNFIAGYEKVIYKEEDPVNIPAAELMGELHDHLKESGYAGHELEVFLVRILFCLFAEDTGIFERNLFSLYLKDKTSEDGADLGTKLSELFQVLNTPFDKRPKTLDESLNGFPYVNGSLFEERLLIPAFDTKMRAALLNCADFNWSKISPAIFGALFQSIMDPEKRRNLGAHYTSEQNILKLIHPLFLDDLCAEFEKCRTDKNALKEFHLKLSRLRFLDPACGCGNFLVITYRELRLLEIEILKILYKGKERFLDVQHLSIIDVDAMFGIEIEEFPAKIAEVALWLMDHQMNVKLSEEMGMHYIRIPLKKSAAIINGNALQLDWEKLVPKTKLNYILGNPPFVGHQHRDAAQNMDMDIVFEGLKGSGVLDFVTCWYIKAAKYIQNTRIKVAFVSTNSITQGEQVAVLWKELFDKYKLKIHFAHRTFSWSSEARGKAHVYVVIVGFACYDVQNKILFDYENPKSAAHEFSVGNINPYLVEGRDILISSNKNPICDVPRLFKGSAPNDDGNFLLTDEEKNALISMEPDSQAFIKPFISAREYMHKTNRWCLWLKDISPAKLAKMKEVQARVEKVREFRLKSRKKRTNEMAEFPTLFDEIRQPDKDYILVPRHTSEHRKYVPLSIFDKNVIIGDSCASLPGGSQYHFGILSSIMHMVWMRYVCGRLESRYRYSNDIVYNNFPWPESPTEKQVKEVERAAEGIISARKEFPESSLADLYDPLTMPPRLLKAHKDLDSAVDLCYRQQPFTSDSNRMEYLFSLYAKYTSPMDAFYYPKKKRKPRKAKGD